jgi:hypothetical protein
MAPRASPATGDASTLSRRAAALRASSRTMLTTQRDKEYSAPQYCTSLPNRADQPPGVIWTALPSAGQRADRRIARARRAILMAVSDQGGSAEMPTERAAGQVSKPDNVPARCTRPQGSNVGFGADGRFPGPP